MELKFLENNCCEILSFKCLLSPEMCDAPSNLIHEATYSRTAKSRINQASSKF